MCDAVYGGTPFYTIPSSGHKPVAPGGFEFPLDDSRAGSEKRIPDLLLSGMNFAPSDNPAERSKPSRQKEPRAPFDLFRLPKWNWNRSRRRGVLNSITPPLLIRSRTTIPTLPGPGSPRKFRVKIDPAAIQCRPAATLPPASWEVLEPGQVLRNSDPDNFDGTRNVKRFERRPAFVQWSFSRAPDDEDG